MRTISRNPNRLSGLLLLCALAAQAGEPVQPAPSRAEMASRLAVVEQQHGPDSAEVIGPLIALANATVAAGSTAEAALLLDRANHLLDLHPEHDRSLRLAVFVLQSENLVRQGQLKPSTDILYKALSLARSTTTIDPGEQADVLDRLAANEGRRGDIQRASTFSNDALKLRADQYGKNSLEYAGALLRTADWYRFSANFSRERELENEALGILEGLAGPKDSRLAAPLIRIGTSYIGQRAHWEQAEQALQRAAALNFSATRDDALTKAEVLASLADLRAVFDKPEYTAAFYTAAWQAMANHPQLGVPTANAYFGKVRRLYVATPDKIASIGGLNLLFTVTPVGAVDAVRMVAAEGPHARAQDQLDTDVKAEVGASAWQALKRSRYRPRVIDGVPVATPDLNFAIEFCMDPTQSCKGRGDMSVAP
jgi:tetratricopeptide (TPR) repeat protein